MVDPGGAIGALSLGLQVIQGLSNYYVRFKSYHADIKAVVDRVATLEEIFRTIEEPIRKLDTGQNPIAKQTRSCISKCLDAVKELDAYEKKCSETKSPADTVLKRAAYPFKKSTLGEIQGLLDRVLEQLQIILQVLSLDTVVRTVEDGNKDTHNQLSQISTAIHDQSNSLQSVDLRLNAHAQGTHRQLSLVQATQDDHVNLTRSVVARLQDQSLQALQMETKIAETIQQGTSRMEDKLDTVLMALQLLHPSHQLQAFQRHGSIEEHTQDRIHPAQSRSCQLLPGSPIRTRLGPPDGHCQRVPTSPEQSIVATFPLNEFTCQCKRLAWRDRKNIPWNKVFFWYTTTTHHPMCPLHIPTQRSTTVAARFILSGYKKGYHIEAALKWGGDFMSPHVIYRNIVSDSAPAFTLVEMLSWFLGQAKDADNISNGLSLTLRTLIALFRDKRAGPRDTDPGGKNLFHVFLGQVAPMLYVCNAISIESHIHQFVEALNGLNIPHSDIDKYGRTPLDMFFDYHADGTFLEIPALADMETSSSSNVLLKGFIRYAPCSFLHFGLPNFYRWIARGNTSHSIESPVLWSICRQSYTDFVDNIEKENLENNQMLLHWACLWPQGLRLLLERDYCTHYLEGCGLSALDWAIGYGEHRKVFSNAEAVDILLQASVPITSHTWALALGSGDQGTQEKIARAIGEEGYPKYGDSQRILTHYHSHHLSVRSAQALFDAGLKDVDVDVAYPLPDHEKQTPLYSASMIFREYPNFNWGEGVLERLRLCQWFVSKGARVDAPHLFALTPAHLIANRLLEAGIALANVRKWEECHPLMNQVFQCRARDSCRCACGNEEGCWVFTPALSDTKYGWAHKTSHKREALEVLLFFDPRIAAHHECCMAICRALTFGELRLTHTCHPHSQYWRHERPPTEEDISEIRNIEEHELAVLEALLEEFEIAWKAFDGTLIEFIDGPWSQRMKMVNNELNDPRPGELQEIQNLGVILTSFGPEEPVEGVPRDSKLIAGSWDWFQRGTEDIMERRDYYWVWQCPWP